MARTAALAAASLAVLGFRSATVPSPPAASQECGARMDSSDVADWQMVEAQGFTFCVPRDWSASGRTWSHGAAHVTWGIGRNIAPADVPSLAQAAARSVPSCVSAPSNATVHPTPEMIGGRQAQVWRARYPGGFYTGGHWYDPHFYIVGEAGDDATADLEMTIVRTVRWTGDAPPDAVTAAAPAGSR